MTEFKPTYLYIKQHEVTGLKYFGKTTRSESFLLENYKGSGKHWTRHINKHGVDKVNTIWYSLFTNRDDLIEFATFFSEEFDIVKSKQWANILPENGIDGGSNGRPGWVPSDSTRDIWRKQRTGRKDSIDTKFKKSQSQKGRTPTYGSLGFKHSESERAARSVRMTDRANRIEVKGEVRARFSKKFSITCPNGNTIEVVGLRKWCIDNNLSYGAMWNAMNRGKSHKGYSILRVIG